MEDLFKDAEWNLKFRRSLAQREVEDWERLTSILESMQLSEGREEMI